MTKMAMKLNEKSNFAVTCNLLSQYIKENRSMPGVRLPTTMSLLSGLDGENATPAAKSMNLFPQIAGFGGDAAAAPAAKSSDGTPEKSQQLTIFYAGKVLVFDNFPAEKAKDIMQMAGKGGSAQNFLFSPPAAAPVAADSTATNQVIGHTANPAAVAQGSTAKPPQPSVSYLPIARKQSLHRFMEKRKERIQAKTPYQTTESSGKVKKEQEENQSWLGLGPQIPAKTNTTA